ncbi:MAG: hypothetical protein BJ554DRAFT_8182 [Olpidium bornovanus]|uniref:Uncharacterized protein n=1 Tax=Olpidium bornovanus TaxID=278681 RepID=A0A8H8DIH6_9FUNG|nr:MAG: hypothetical protein BJ554DRAFT_8182 [Olpidium bornovanus]
MNVDLRTSLRTKINRTAPEYGLHELYFPSFVRTYGWEYKFSSADAVYAVTAVIECSPGIAASLGAHIDWTDGSHSAAALVDAGGGGASDGNEEFGLGFYKALDALDKCSFRLAVLRDEPDLQILCHPLTLSKLSLFLVDAMRVTPVELHEELNLSGNLQEYGKTNLPFVLAVLDEQKDRYLVAGVTGSARHGDVRKKCVVTVPEPLYTEAHFQARLPAKETEGLGIRVGVEVYSAPGHGKSQQNPLRGAVPKGRPHARQAGGTKGMYPHAVARHDSAKRSTLPPSWEDNGDMPHVGVRHGSAKCSTLKEVVGLKPEKAAMAEQERELNNTVEMLALKPAPNANEEHGDSRSGRHRRGKSHSVTNTRNDPVAELIVCTLFASVPQFTGAGGVAKVTDFLREIDTAVGAFCRPGNQRR